MKNFALILIVGLLLSACDGSIEYANKGKEYLAKGDFENAVKYLLESIEENPNLEAYNSLGIAYYELGEYNKSLGAFNGAIDLDANDYRPFYNRGNTYLQLEYYNKAISDYSQAIKRNGEIADIYLNRGNCYYYLKKFDEAINEYNMALDRDNGNFLTFFNKGKSQVLLKSYSDASSSLQASVNLNNKYAPSYYWLGVCETELGNSEKGCLHFKQAARLDDPNAATAVAQLCGT